MNRTTLHHRSTDKLRNYLDAAEPKHVSIGPIGTLSLGSAENHSKDILGCIYEYFPTQFASDEGKNGGLFYTPQCLVRVLVGMLAPCKGGVYDSCWSSVGKFVKSERFVEDHGGRRCLVTTAYYYTGTFAKAGWLEEPEQSSLCRTDTDFQTFIEQISFMPSISKTCPKPEVHQKLQMGEGTIQSAFLDATRKHN